MPTFVVTAPDGKKYRVNAPEGATQQQAIAYVADTYYSAPREQEQPETTALGQAWEGLKAVPSSLIGLAELGATGASALLPEEAERAAREKIASTAETLQEPFAPRPGYEDSMVRNIVGAASSTIPYFALGALGPVGLVGAGALGVSTGAGEARVRAEQEGATEEEIAAATAGGAGVGAFEIFAPFKLFKRIGKEATDGIVDRIKEIAKTAGEEAAQEAAAQFAQNAIAKGIYKPDQALIEYVGEEAAFGGAAGAISATLINMALGRRGAQVKPPEEPTVPETPVTPESVTTPEAATAETVTPTPTPPTAQVKPEENVAADLINAVGDIDSAPEIAATEVPMGERPTVAAAPTAEPPAEPPAGPPAGPPAVETPPAAATAPEPTDEQDEAAKKRADRQAARWDEIENAEIKLAEDYGRQAARDAINEYESDPSLDPEEIQARYEELVFSEAGSRAEYAQATFRKELASLSKQLADKRLAEQEAKLKAESDTKNVVPLVQPPQFEEIKFTDQNTGEEIRPDESFTYDRNTGKSLDEFDNVGQEVTQTGPRRRKSSVVSSGPADVIDIKSRQRVETPQISAPEQALINRVTDIIREKGQSSAVAIQKGLGVRLEEAKAIRESLIQNGLLVKRGRSYVLKEEPSAELTRPDERGISGSVPESVQEGGTYQPTPQEVELGRVEPVGGAAIVSDGREAAGDVALTEFPSAAPPPPAPAVDRLNLIRQAAERRQAQQAPQAPKAPIAETPAPATPVKQRFQSVAEARSALSQAFDNDVISEENYEAGINALKSRTPNLNTIQSIIDGTYAPKRTKEKDIGLKFKEEGEAPAAPLPIERTNQVIQEASSGWTNRPDINVVKSVPDLPEGLRQRVSPTAKGFYDPSTGVVHVISDNISSESDAKATLFHESLGHYGFDQEFQNELNNVLSDIYNTNTNARSEADKFLKDNPDAYANLEPTLRNARAVEEVLAKKAEAGPIKEPGLRAAYNRLAAFIRNVGRRMGLVSTYSDNDVTQVLRRASSRVIKGTGTASRSVDKDLRFSDSKNDVVNRRRKALDSVKSKGTFRKIVDKLTQKKAYEKIVKSLANSRRDLLAIQRALESTGKLEITGPGKNNIHDSAMRQPNIMANIISMIIEPVNFKAYRAISSYAAAKNITVKEAVAQLDSYFIALHEPERRRLQFARLVKLDNIKQFVFGNVTATPAEMRDRIQEAIRKSKTVAEAERLGQMLYRLAENTRYHDPAALPITDAKYNVVGPEYTDAGLALLRKEATDPNNPYSGLISNAYKAMQEVNEVNKTLNRKSNYWTDATDRMIASYGWKNYVPFKGMPNSQKELDPDFKYISGELAEAEGSFDGRRSEFDSPILQMFAEGYPAASRAARAESGLMTTIKNLIDSGVIKVKSKSTRISWEERSSKQFNPDKITGRDKVLFYNSDGSVDVYTLKDPDQIEAIKGTFQKLSEGWQIFSTATSILGQLHTRYNIAFPPMDFIRNSITNAINIALFESPAKGMEYAYQVASGVLRLGFGKSWAISRAVSRGDKAEIEALRKESQFGADVLDLIERGGKTAYKDIFDLGVQLNNLEKSIGKDGIIKDEPGTTVPEAFRKFFDAYNDSFELTSRVAAYRVRLNDKMQEMKSKNIKITPEIENDLKNDAAAFALELMNFRQTGSDFSRKIGAFYMFWRPSVISAVKTLDGLKPAFVDVENAMQNLPDTIKEKMFPGSRRKNKKGEYTEKEEDYQARLADGKRMRDAFTQDYMQRKDNAQLVMSALFLVGVAAYGMSRAAAGEDEEGRNIVSTDDKSRWTRYWRIPSPFAKPGDKNQFIQLPWGFGASAFMASGAQIAAITAGDSTMKKFSGNIIEIGLDSMLPIPVSRINPFENIGMWLVDSVTPSVAKGAVQTVTNIDAFGSPIANYRADRYASSFTKSTRASELATKMSQAIYNSTADIMSVFGKGPLEINPNMFDFLLNNYFDAPNILAEGSYNLYLVAKGEKEFDPKTDAFILRSFIGTQSNYDAEQYAVAEKAIKNNARVLETFARQGDAERFYRYLDENPNALVLKEIYDKINNGSLRQLRQYKNEVMREPSLTAKERQEILDDIRRGENSLKRAVTDTYKAYK